MANDFQDDWDTPLSLIHHHPFVSKERLEEIICNYRFLPDFLGMDWISDEKNKNHPLWIWFGNSVEVLRLSELGLSLQLLQNKTLFPDILSRLLSDTPSFEGAYYELITGYYLFKHGYAFEYVKEKKRNRSSDIILQGPEREILVEITHKDYPDEFILYFNNNRRITIFLMLHLDGLIYNIDVLKPLSTPTTEQIINECKILIEQAKISGFEEYHEINVIDIYIYKLEFQEKVPIEKRKMQLKFPELDEIPRIKGTIKEKQKQIDLTKAGVIIIYDDICFCQTPFEDHNMNLIFELDQVVYEYPNISALILISTEHPVSNDRDNYSKISSEFIIRNVYEIDMMRRRNILVIFNKYASLPFDEVEKEMIGDLFL